MVMFTLNFYFLLALTAFRQLLYNNIQIYTTSLLYETPVFVHFICFGTNLVKRSMTNFDAISDRLLVRGWLWNDDIDFTSRS